MQTLKHINKNLHVTFKNTVQLQFYQHLKYITEKYCMRIKSGPAGRRY